MNKSKYRIKIEDGTDTVKKVNVNGRDFDVDLLQPDTASGGEKSVKIGDNDYKFNLINHKLELGRAQFELQLNNKYAVLEALMPHIHRDEFVQDSSDNIAAEAVKKKGRGVDALKDRSAGTTKTAEGGVYAPMPGRLVALKVAIGDKIKAGQVVAILEAMKMENELKAASAGTVKEINYKPGDNVSQDRPIMIIG